MNVMRERSFYRGLESSLGYRFKRRAWLEQALTHRSFRYETDDVDVDNERLEFLGDALLGFLVAAHVFEQLGEHREGSLTAMRSRVTNGEALADLARELDIGTYLRMGQGEVRSGGRERRSNLANAMEALLGAVYMDGGMRGAKAAFKCLFVPRLSAMEHDPWADNPKGQLQELSQARWKASPLYRLLEKSGPSHAATFEVEVVLADGQSAIGRGASKQAAEREAAQAVLDRLAAATERH